MDNLSPEQFRDALRKGLGRAVRNVRNSPPETVREDLAYACTHFLGLNLQDEGGRDPWLFRMIEITGEFDFYRQKIVEAMEKMPDDPDDAQTCNELFSLLAEFAARGDNEVLEIMRRRFDSASILYQSSFGYEDMFRVEGIDALIRQLRREWKRICDDEELWADDYEIRFAEEQLGKEIVQTTLEEASRNDESIRLYIERMRKQHAEQEARKAAEQKLLEIPVVPSSLRELIDNLKDEWPTETVWTSEAFRKARQSRRNKPLQFERLYTKPTSEELEYAFQKLLDANDPGHQLCLLSVFIEETMPRFDPHLFSLLFNTPHMKIRWAAEQALACMTDPVIRKKGLELIAKKPGSRDWYIGVRARA